MEKITKKNMIAVLWIYGIVFGMCLMSILIQYSIEMLICLILSGIASKFQFSYIKTLPEDSNNKENGDRHD